MKKILTVLVMLGLISACAKQPIPVQQQVIVQKDLLSEVTTITESNLTQDGNVTVNVYIHNPLEYPLRVFELTSKGGQR